MQPKSGAFMDKIIIKLEISYEKSDKIHDIDIKIPDINIEISDIDIKIHDIDTRIPDINIKISDIDIKIHDTAADHQSKNLGKLSRSFACTVSNINNDCTNK